MVRIIQMGGGTPGGGGGPTFTKTPVVILKRDDAYMATFGYSYLYLLPDVVTSKTSITARWDLASAAPGDGMCYFAGGANGAYLGTNEQYDPALNVVTSKALITARREGSGAAPGDGMCYFVAGYTTGGIGLNEMYDPERALYKL
jgi:hypothetical protein